MAKRGSVALKLRRGRRSLCTNTMFLGWGWCSGVAVELVRASGVLFGFTLFTTVDS